MSCKKYFYTILISIFFFNISLFAQNESLKDTLVLTQTLITAQSRTLYTESLRIVRTINIKEIVGMPIVNLNELLDYLPGVDVRQRGTNGVQADITIRGGTFDQVLILLNGVNITDPQTGHHNLDIPVNISMIDKIEVLQGTTMNQFGLSAFSGAINIITCKSEENVVKAGVAVGQYGYFAPYLGIKNKKNRWNSVFSLSHDYSSGYINNTDYSIGNIFFHTKYNGGKAGMFEFQIGGQMKEFGSNGFYSLSYPNEFEATKTGFIALNLGKNISRQIYLESSIYQRTHCDRFELFRDMEGAASWYKGHNYHLSTVSGGNLKMNINYSLGKSSFGVELRNEHILSTVLGDEMGNPQTHIFFPDSVIFNHQKNRMNLNYFMEHSLYIGDIAVSAGVSGNYNSISGDNICFGINAGYTIKGRNRIYFNAHKAVRLPTFTDLYYSSVNIMGNPDLKAEESYTAEAGFTWKNKTSVDDSHLGLISVQGIIYYRIGKNIIDWIRQKDSEMWQCMNHTQSNAFGTDIIIRYIPNIKFIKSAGISYSGVNLNLESGEMISSYALDYMKHKVVFDLDIMITNKIGTNIKAVWQDRYGNYTSLSGEITPYAPYTLTDMKLYWDNGKYRIYGDISNMLDTQYFDYGGILQPGIWGKIGISTNFSF